MNESQNANITGNASNVTTTGQSTWRKTSTLWMFTTVALVIMIVMICCGNVLVLVATWLEKRLHHPNKYFIACLAVADLFVGIFSVPIRLYIHLHNNELMQVELCRFWNWIDISCEVASIITLATISVDRYIKITKPFKYRSLMTTSRSNILIFLIWFISLGFATLGLFSYGKSRGSFAVAGYGCLYDNPVYVTVTAFVFFFGPLTIMVVMYALIFYTAHRRKKLARNGTLGQSYHSKGSRRKSFAKDVFQELKIVRVLLLVVVTFMVCWGPFFTIYLLNLYYKSNYVWKSLNTLGRKIVATMFVTILPSFNSLCNPVIYACFDREYGKAFKILFQRVFCCRKHAELAQKLSRKRPRSEGFHLTIYHNHTTSRNSEFRSPTTPI